MARCLLGTLIALLLGAVGAAAADALDNRPVITVGIVYDGPPPDQEVVSIQRFLEIPEEIRRETLTLTRRDFDVRFPPDKRLMGGWNMREIRAAIDRQLADPEVDLVLTLGVFGSTVVCRRRDLPKPVVAPFAVDATAQSLPFVDNTSGVENLNYLIRRGNVLQDLETFRERLVAFDRLHVLVDTMFVESMPELPGYVAALDQRIGAKATLVPVESSAEDALAALDDAEAIYVTPMMRMPGREFDRLVEGLIERGLPSFSLQGEVEVERGLLAGLRRATDLSRMARRVALNIQRILLGEDAGSLPVTLEQPERLLINMATADAIGFSPRWRVTLEADLIHEAWPWGHKPTVEEALSLSRAVEEAVAANLALAVSDRRVDAGSENVQLARSLTKPRIEASSTGVQIEETSANVLQPERRWTGRVAATQVLFSDELRGNVSVSSHLQDALEWEYEVQRLDVALDAATAFLNVLRAQTRDRVAEDNLRLTESNLELARTRESIGFSGPADVYRWEAELATDRSEVIFTHSQVHRAFIALNRVLHRPLEQIHEAEPPPLQHPRLITGAGRLNPYIDNAAGFDLFREFSVEEGLANSPELKGIDASIAARERELVSAKRAYWSPEVALVGDLGREFSRDGAGEDIPISPLFTVDRDTWTIGVTATLPLYTGGSRKAVVRQSSEELSALQLERASVVEQLEARIRGAVFSVSATFPTIELAQEAATAARKNLDLVTDAYSRGVVSIIDLLDAQNAALVAEEFASNAVYNFLVDLMELQRATGDFDFFRSDEGREAWFSRLEAYFAQAGYRARR